MTDRRDPEEEDLRELLADLESTLVELRGELDEERPDTPRIPRGLPGGGRRAPRPPRLREVLRFTEEYTIPTLISILEANIRLLRLGGAALRALDPERSAVPSERGEGAVGRALDAGRGFSTDRLASGLEDLNDALSGTEAPDPEARELLSEAEELSTEIQDRLREAGGGSSQSGKRREGVGGVGEPADVDDETPAPDVDAELDSIREEVRGPREESENAEAGTKEDSEDADEDSEDADGTPLE